MAPPIRTAEDRAAEAGCRGTGAQPKVEDAGGEVAGPPVDADGGGRGRAMARSVLVLQVPAVWRVRGRSLEQVSFAWNYMGDEAVGRLLQAVLSFAPLNELPECS